MANCPECNRSLPLSGKCPFCQKGAASGGFSLNRLLNKPGAAPKPVETIVSRSAQTTADSDSIEFPDLEESSPAETSENVYDIDEPILPPNLQSLAAAGGFRQPEAEVEQGSLLDEHISDVRSGQYAADSSEEVVSPRPSAGFPGSIGSRPVPLSTLASRPPTGAFGGQKPATASSGSVPDSRGLQKVAESSGDPVQASFASLNLDEETVFSSKVFGFGDEEMECSVLSGILNDSYILEQITIKGLIPDLFSNSYSRAMCKAVLGLREESREGSVVDKIVIKNKLKQQGIFDQPMQNFMTRVMAQPVPSLDQAMHYLDLLKEQALKRKLKEVAENIEQYLSDSNNESKIGMEQFTNSVIRNVREVQKARGTKKINLVKEEMREIIRDMESREVKGEVDIIGYSFSPMNFLNSALSGFRKGFMYAIAGAPRRGKTTFTLELATLTATNNNIPVIFFTYEQTKKNLTYRLLAKESRLNPDTLQRKKIRSDMIMDAKFMGGWKRMQSYMDYFYIVEATKADTIDRIRSYAYNVMQDFNTEDVMIFIDYIQKMPLSRDYLDEKFKVEEISTELKALSIELNNPIMTVSSLSKEGCMIDATESVERPTMYHCKGSGDLEYDLDCAMIQAKDWADTRELYRQLQHKAEGSGKDSTRVPKVDVVNLYLDKNRDAPEGIYSAVQYLFFIGDNKFIELGPKYDDDRFRYSKIEGLVDELMRNNYIIFYDRPGGGNLNKGRVSIKLKNV